MVFDNVVVEVWGVPGLAAWLAGSWEPARVIWIWLAGGRDELSKQTPARGLTHFEGFDPGSERTLAAWIRHASRGNRPQGREPA